MSIENLVVDGLFNIVALVASNIHFSTSFERKEGSDTSL